MILTAGFVFLCSAGQFVGHAAGCAVDLVHVLGVAGAAGARVVAPSHGTGWEVEGGERRGVLQRDKVHSVSDEALFCLISQHPQEFGGGDAPTFVSRLPRLSCRQCKQASLCFLHSTASQIFK